MKKSFTLALLLGWNLAGALPDMSERAFLRALDGALQQGHYQSQLVPMPGGMHTYRKILFGLQGTLWGNLVYEVKTRTIGPVIVVGTAPEGSPLLPPIFDLTDHLLRTWCGVGEKTDLLQPLVNLYLSAGRAYLMSSSAPSITVGSCTVGSSYTGAGEAAFTVKR